jgi:hypothetical protein
MFEEVGRAAASSFMSGMGDPLWHQQNSQYQLNPFQRAGLGAGADLMKSAGVNDGLYRTQEQQKNFLRQQYARSIVFPCGCRVPLLSGKSNVPLDNQCGCGKWVRKEVISDDGAYKAWRKA